MFRNQGAGFIHHVHNTPTLKPPYCGDTVINELLFRIIRKVVGFREINSYEMISVLI